MAYTISWDEGVPVGATTPAADIDTELQKIKTGLRERLEQVIPDFDDDLADPKKLAIVIGDAASRPASPDYAGEMYFAYDTGILYIGDPVPAWVSVGQIVEPGDEAESTTLSWCGRLTGDNNFAGGAWHALAGWTTVSDFGGFYSGAQPTRITFPASGRYVVHINAVVDSGNIDLGIDLNGSGSPFTGLSRSIVNGVTTSLSRVMLFNAGDYIEFVVQADIFGTIIKGSPYTTAYVHRLL